MASYLVSGAGSSYVNGSYVNTGELINGRESYRYTGSSIPGGTEGFLLYWFTGVGGPYWTIDTQDDVPVMPGSFHYYINTADTLTPPESGWVLASESYG